LKILKQPLIAVLAVVALAATGLSVGAGSALASPVKAQWVGLGSFPGAPGFFSGELTLKLGGENPKTCQLAQATKLWNESSQGDVLETQFREACSTGLIEGSIVGSAWFEAGYKLKLTWGGKAFESPYGSYLPQEFTVPFVNAEGTTPSHVTFTNTVIGATLGTPSQQITASGTLNVTSLAKSGGVSRTLTH
jgi:hypothetical protein